MLVVGGERIAVGEREERAILEPRRRIVEVDVVPLLLDITDLEIERDLTESVPDPLQELAATVELLASVGVAAGCFVGGRPIGFLTSSRAVEGLSQGAVDVQPFSATSAAFGCWFLADFALAASAGVDVGCRHPVVLCVVP